MTGLSRALARGRLTGLMPLVQRVCVSMGRTQPTYSGPGAGPALEGHAGLLVWGAVPGPWGKWVVDPGAWAFQPPTEQRAAGPGSEQAGLWVAGSPEPQAAGCLLPRPPSSSSLSPAGPVKCMDRGNFRVCPVRGLQAGLASSPSPALAWYLGQLP